MTPEVHKVCIELFVFYLVQLPHTPVCLRKTLESAQNEIYRTFDRKPFKVSILAVQPEFPAAFFPPYI
jgi:hypothetical protein